MSTLTSKEDSQGKSGRQCRCGGSLGTRFTHQGLMSESLNPFEIARAQFEHAIRFLPELKVGLVEFLQYPVQFIAANDANREIFNDAGRNLDEVDALRLEMGTVVGAPHTTSISNSELLCLPCEILLPAALENQIREDDAREVQTRLVVKGANGPTNPGADAIFSSVESPSFPISWPTRAA